MSILGRKKKAKQMSPSELTSPDWARWLEVAPFPQEDEPCLTGNFLMENGRLIYGNVRLAELLGYSAGELIGKKLEELVHPLDLELVSDRNNARLHGLPVPSCYEIRVLCGGGQTKRVLINVTLTTGPQGQTLTVGSVLPVD